jgi:sialate O-acetylesterase
VINSSVGGTPIESWISEDAQNRDPEVKKYLDQQHKPAAGTDPAAEKAKYEKALANWKAAAAKAKKAGQKVPRAPRDPVALRERKSNVAGLFNGMIAPLIPYAIRGGIWYQGEANSAPEKAPFYQYQLPCLVQDWRARWGQGDFPFAWVQLPNYDTSGRDWPTMRECMMKTLKVPNTGMAITIDVGEARDIHPKNKQAVGKRLALWALGTVYGQKGPISGPLPDGCEFRGSEGVLKFKYTDGGLTAKGGDLKGFTIAGSDKKFVPAKARIEGNQVIVSSPDVKQPAAVRYAWQNYPDCNLYNGADLPASPFRTDDWAPEPPAK